MKDSRYDYPLFLFVLFTLSLFMVCWFAPVSEYGGHDYFFNFRRFNVLMEALQAGKYPIYLDFNAMEGYGYFTKAFYPDLMLLPFAAIGLLIGPVAAYNVMIFTLTFLCGLFMYHAVKTVFDNRMMASFSAILYTFSAYHLFDWYNRGALGESISFTFLPLIFLGLYHIIAGDSRKWYLLAIGYTLLLYTHLLSSFLTFITLAIVVLVCYKPLIKEPKRIGYLLLATAVTVLLTASYILPMFEQMASNTFNYSHAVNITGQTKLSIKEMGWGMLSGVFNQWGSNMSGTGPLLIILVILRLFIREKSSLIRIADICALIGIAYMIVMSFIFPWGRLPLGFIQFPWRLYEFVIFFFAIAGAYYLMLILKSRKQQLAAGAVIVFFAVITIVVTNNSYIYWQSQAKTAVPELFTGIPSVDNEYYLGGREYMPASVPSYRLIHERGDSIKAQPATVAISNLVKSEGITRFDVIVDSPAALELPLLYYKGYNATLNGKNIPIGQSDWGLLTVPTDESGKIEVYYRGTMVQKISWYITLLSALAFCIYIFVSRKKKEPKIQK
ncbi:hypothetical protein M2451_003274 [Dysgonomonas sp. PFB1-18]|uniref:YfhO family protein n=1 Tax=unclassified Dysgonomonas TaxID=2630389 RepID=UPI0024768E98|nr:MULTISPECIES: YfhO family protein [unclassified Dysgonomonas]MDH6310387.1 hypothetical protein [Dysgonomonas sp. PF1-14]MDH6340283.1 hypothetical protein [Dysgonomonas sp. PF1-16]MDH6381937.1 hypothetical protein [Dysgonomonas sp. PFB1-18]MDH6399254.1 hypothetical protein [Dysgonomonas sp. PF1-23]